MAIISRGVTDLIWSSFIEFLELNLLHCFCIFKN